MLIKNNLAGRDNEETLKRTTLKDIAKLTGLSVSGVSRALKDHPDISEETKTKVREVAEALNYSPNLNAQFLRTRSSKIIAVILPKADTFFFPELLRGISEVVSKQGYSLMYLQTENSLEREKELIDFCLKIYAEGVLISLTHQTTDLKHLDKLKAAEIPVLMIDKGLTNDWTPFLNIDDQEATFRAIDYLLKKGYRHILGIFDHPNLLMTQRRAEGFREAHRQHKLDCHPDQILMSKNDTQLPEEIMVFLRKKAQADAVFTMSDKLMVQAYNVINKLGYVIPDDIALISISDGKAPYYLYPNVSYISHSGYEVGKTGTQLLFQMINGTALNRQFYKIETRLIELEST
jgi:DNA-binding LacI/PurR family transcriptional regulator